MPRFRTSETPVASETPRHAAPRHAAVHAAGIAPQRHDPSTLRPLDATTPATMPAPASATPRFAEEALEGSAVRPVLGEDAMAPDAFDTLSAGSGALMGRQGAAGGSDVRGTGVARAARGASSQRMDSEHRPSYRSSQRKVRVSRGPIVAIAIACACVLVAVVVLVANAVSAQRAVPDVEDADRLEETEVQPGQSILYDGYTYLLSQDAAGAWTFVRSSSAGADPLVLFEFPGTPLTLILHEGAFIIPQNLDGTWNVVAWTMGDGSVPTLLAREDGSAVEGEGQLVEATLDGSKIVFTLADGSTEEAELF